MTYQPQQPATNQPSDSAKPKTSGDTSTSSELSTYGYRQIDAFFNVREANSNVQKGQWEYQTTFTYETRSGTSDQFWLKPSLKYGITNDLYVEIDVPLLFGDGGDQGNGDLGLIVFNQFVHESEKIPAFAMWANMRIPSGQGSSGVDLELHFNVTKTLLPKFRAHMEGFIETANGYRGSDDELDRRNFQWGVGPGVDYQFDEKTMGVLNYVNRSSEDFGNSNQNIFEVGVTREIVQGQHLKLAADFGLDGSEQTDNWVVKIQYAINW